MTTGHRPTFGTKLMAITHTPQLMDYFINESTDFQRNPKTFSSCNIIMAPNVCDCISKSWVWDANVMVKVKSKKGQGFTVLGH